MAEVVSNEFKEMCKTDAPSGALGRIRIIENDAIISENTDIQDIQIEDNCYVNDKFIGTTVAKKVTVNLFNDNNIYDLEDKEIEVELGFDLDGEELVSYGNFIIEKPNTEEVQAKTHFVGYDYMVKFNKEFVDNNTYPVALGTYFSNLCTQVGLIAGDTNFINSNYMVQGNPFTNGETCKVVLSAIAQIAGGVAKIGRDNKPYIFSLSKGEETEIIDGNNYDSFSPNNIFGPINKVIIKMQDDVEGEESVRADAQSIEQNGECAITISNNPILSSHEQRELVIDNIFNTLKGITYLPFKTSYYGYPYSDSTDKIKILNVNDTEYDSYIFNHTIKYDGAFSGSIETLALTKTQSMYRDTRSLKGWTRNVELKVDKINGEISSVIEETTDLDNPNSIASKQSILTQRVDKLESDIGEIADITTSQETITGRLIFENINQSEPIRIAIRPIGESITYLYPRDDLFPADNLYLTGRTLRFTNTTTSEVFEWELPDDLLYYDAENYDEFIMDYDGDSCYVNKKCEYNSNGEVVLKSQEAIEEFPFPHEELQLTDGDYTVEILKYETTPYQAYLFARMMVQNYYTTQFATRAEMNTKISQTSTNILASVNAKFTNYSTTTEMNTTVNLKANELLGQVSETYATKSTTNSLSTRIKQTAKSIELAATDNNTSCGLTIRLRNEDGTQIDSKSANITLSGLVKFTDLSTSGNTTINGSNITTGTIDASRVNVTNINASNITTGTISANKISGGSLNLTGTNTTISSTKFSVDKNGNITATGGTIGGFTIGAHSITAQNGNNTVFLDDASNGNQDFLVVRTGTSGNYSYPFFVRADGTMHANKATISGTITATSGTFQNCTITNTCTVPAGTISGTLATSNIPNLSASKITSGTMSGDRINGGTITASKLVGVTVVGDSIQSYGRYYTRDPNTLQDLTGQNASIIVQHEGQYWRKLVFTGGILTAVLSSW